MSVDLNLYLPPTAAIEDVGFALAALHGIPTQKRDFGSESYSWAARPIFQNAVNFRPATPGYYVIEVLAKGAYSFFFEPSTPEVAKTGYRLIIINSNPLNIAIAERLLRIFGGRLIYKDCSDKTFTNPDRNFPAKIMMAANDGAAWALRQQALLDITPIRKSEINKAAYVSAYDNRKERS